jgi:hypothetical protein
MLDGARQRCTAYLSANANATTLSKAPEVKFWEFDALHLAKFPDVKESVFGRADVVLSTLVLEHLPISAFFFTVEALLKENEGYLVLTNMHAEMGRRGQAGFVDEETGEKIRGESCVYETEEVLEEGKKWGFRLEGEVGERMVGEEDVGEGKLLGSRGRKWIGVKVWFGMVLRYVGRQG